MILGSKRVGAILNVLI